MRASHGQFATCTPVYRPCLLASMADMLASSISMFTTILLKGQFIFHRLGQVNELAVGRSKKFGHNEDTKGSCMENEQPPQSGP